MARLSVRKLDDKIYEQLRVRAAIHGISMEEEARRIIVRAVETPEQIGNVFKKYFGAANGVDLGLLNQRAPHQPLDFNDDHH